ncbi:hypothetical protein [Mycolicibacterium neworleansense]|uniref:hypothetical protein n=1 Tax=Mycolicibacterium neworleansense TaxID=146018 RepID=UPI0010402CE6|nr:hypothetical protein [Mycolicibacterium neworleansense]MCV7365416.1 hypothetical protein [Mycolicibacterium neworleansense]
MEDSPPEEYPHEWVDRYGPQAYAPHAHVQQSAAAKRQYQTTLAIRGFAGLIGGGAMVLWALVVFVMLSSAFDTDSASDPHGYGIVFGILMYLPLGLVWSLVLPFAAPRHRWGRAFAISLLTFVTVTGLVLVALSASGAG